MNSNRVALFASSLICILTLWVRFTSFSNVSSHGRYYLASIAIISGIIAMITFCRTIRKRHEAPVSTSEKGKNASGQRRQYYRMKFEPSTAPIFVQKTEDFLTDPSFTCPVIDISETGIGLSCSGTYAKGETVTGEIIFDSGRTASVNGVVVRQDAQCTIIRLHCTISAHLLMIEQREQISSKKALGPLPVVCATEPDVKIKSLPSHAPKGFCRIKK